MSRLAGALLLSLALTQAQVAWSYDTMGATWRADFESGEEIPWVLNDLGCPDFDLELTQEILETSFQAWEDVDCATIGFTYEGTTEQDVTTSDGVNLMVWRTSGWSYGIGALGVTGTWFGGIYLTDADIEFNSVHYTWSENGQGNTIDLQSVATHEIGHFLGLDHSDFPDAVMYYAYSGGTSQRNLSDDDRSGVCYLYPAEGGGCVTEDDCPIGHECHAGDCVPVGNGDVCDRCVSDDQCGGANDRCVTYPDGSSRCGRSCDADEDCDDAPGCDERDCACREMSAGSGQCVAASLSCDEGPECDDETPCPDGLECVEGQCVEGGCTELGGECEGHGDCCSEMCLDGQCSQPCDWLQPRESCPNGFYCEIQECGVGACMSGRLGSGARSSSCEAHEECSTGYCASTGGPTSCSVACDPDGINTCPEGEGCYRIGASVCGVCACQIGRLGDSCEEQGECASGVCATKSGERRCSRLCSEPSNPCPDGYDCLDAGTRSICWPQAAGLGSTCASDSDCTDGLCRAERCTRSCETDCDCATGFHCGEIEGELFCVRGGSGGDDDGGSRGCDCGAASTGQAGQAPLGVLALALTLLWLVRRR